MRYHIIAPHVDDEVIGCWSLLHDFPLECVVHYIDPPSAQRRVEVKKYGLKNGHEWAWMSRALLSSALDEALDEESKEGEMVVVAPDFYFDTHPLHREVGSLVVSWAGRRQVRCQVYNTRMNAPYVVELSRKRSIMKRNVLQTFYPSQKSLWASDHRFFLFEGRAEWNLVS